MKTPTKSPYHPRKLRWPLSRVDHNLLDEVRARALSQDIPVVWAIREALVAYAVPLPGEAQAPTIAVADAIASPSADKQDDIAPTANPETRSC